MIELNDYLGRKTVKNDDDDALLFGKTDIFIALAMAVVIGGLAILAVYVPYKAIVLAVHLLR